MNWNGSQSHNELIISYVCMFISVYTALHQVIYQTALTWHLICMIGRLVLMHQ